ncbi:hypothetical protein PBI_JEANIE_22 [Gordonia phage Jeanie]|uniref:Uncharacterized protein n=2 Tax=root TaxID=1 RepID=A0A160DHC9_9CAUD|nr:hypothetical protein [Gordonia neofelifaecis]YP_009274034.1 hypothetical protein BH764_gp22 [Gordonia phage McGonagall]ANA87600.1 hypothetical protein MCGONAGALL_22 [Gordonia phage McGonagall]ANA87627.1 hypothetical protein PBI_JEANIE_22 [Gordonia phage Jeanie]EGD53228.1 hypothetical protein SCNU_20112 [Gordonia neofelifaecis NRRL B-59395]
MTAATTPSVGPLKPSQRRRAAALIVARDVLAERRFAGSSAVAHLPLIEVANYVVTGEVPGGGE